MPMNLIISTLPKTKQINDVTKQLSALMYEYDLTASCEQ